MRAWLSSVGIELALLLVVSLIGYGVRYGQERLWVWWQRRTLGKFFGLPDASVTIVHGAIYDPERQAFNYAASDPRAARSLAALFYKFHLREGRDFAITTVSDPRQDSGKEVEMLSDSEINKYDELWSKNVILIGGPRRNPVLDSLLPQLRWLRYRMKFDRLTRQTLLTDMRRHQQLTASREDPQHQGQEAYDYALVASAPNPHNPQRRLVIVAGIHGTGTLGAAQYIAEPDNLKSLLKRSKNGVVAEALLIKYPAGDPENPADSELC